MDGWLPGTKGAEGKWGVAGSNYGLSYWGNENVLKLIVVIAAQL